MGSRRGKTKHIARIIPLAFQPWRHACLPKSCWSCCTPLWKSSSGVWNHPLDEMHRQTPVCSLGTASLCSNYPSNRRLGVVNRSGADAPHRESKPSAHAPAPHARHDRSMARSCLVARMIFEEKYRLTPPRVQRPICFNHVSETLMKRFLTKS